MLFRKHVKMQMTGIEVEGFLSAIEISKSTQTFRIFRFCVEVELFQVMTRRVTCSTNETRFFHWGFELKRKKIYHCDG